MEEVPTWEALFERAAREDIDEEAIEATLAAMRDREAVRDS